MSVDWPRFTQEVRRIHARYMVEVVEAFGLCPWARDARVKGRVNLRVTFLTAPDPVTLAAEVDACMQPAATEIGMLLCPLLALTPRQWRHVAADVRVLEEQRHAKPRFAVADFHPIAAADLTTADRLVPFLRRSPDLMLQIVRTDVLAHVRHAQAQGTAYVDPSMLEALAASALDQLAISAPSLSARVAETNLRTMQREGAEVAAVVEDIHADRNRAYAAVGYVVGMAGPTQAHISDTREPTMLAVASDRDETPESKAGYSSAVDESHNDSSFPKCNDI